MADPESTTPPRREWPLRPGLLGFYALLALSLVLMGYVCWPFRVPLFLSAVLAAALMPLHRRLMGRLGGRRALSAALLTLLVLAVIVAPLAAVVGVLTHQAIAGVQFIQETLGVSSVSQLRPGALPPQAEMRVDRLLGLVHLKRDQLQPLLERAGNEVQHLAPRALEASGRALLHSVAMLLALFFFLAEGGGIIEWLVGIAPLEDRQTRQLIDEFRKVSRAALVGTLATALIQGVLASGGYALFGMPEPLFFGLLTGLSSFIPVVGTTLVWVPAVAWLWLTDRHGGAVGLAIWSAVLVVGSEHVAKPFILKGQVEMHTGLVFLSLLGGIAMYGLIGILAGPLTVAFFLAMTGMYARDFRRRPNPQP